MNVDEQFRDTTLSKKRRLGHEIASGIAINELEVEAMRQVKKIKTKKKQIPKFRLKSTGDSASLSTLACDRVPLMLTDIQHLLLHSLMGNLNLSQQPRWYVLDKCNAITQTTCLILEGVSIQHWKQYSSKLVQTNKIFNTFVEILTPSVYDGSLVNELALVPISETEKEAILQKYGSMNLALEARKDLMIMMKAIFPTLDKAEVPSETKSEDKFSRTQLILSAWQLIEENYPLPLKGKLKDAYSDYVLTKDNYEPVTSKSPMFGLDCEMCITNAGSELTRLSMVDENLETVYESLVKPYNEITDYLTKYSGITKTLLNNVTKRLEDVQQDLKKILPPDAILVGHSLNVDLHALKMMHPYVIDTSSIYNFTGERSRKSKLKVLAREFLNEIIQSGKSGHCSVEDAVTAMKLVQLKLTKSLDYGDAVHTNRQQYKENYLKRQKVPEYALSIFNHMIEQKKTSMVVGCDDITGDYHTYITRAKDSVTSHLKKAKPKKIKLNTVDTVEEVISNLSEAANDFNFAMAHLKLQLNSENESDYFQLIDKWIETIWKSVAQNSLFVVLFGGSCEENGLAMINVKN